MFEADNRVKLYLAHVIYDAERYNDAADIVRQLVESKYIVPAEDRMLLVNIWLGIINPHRTAILNIKDMKSSDHLHLALSEISETLNKLLDEIIEIIQMQIISQSIEEEGKAIYYKFLADFQRYKLDCVDSSQIPQIASDSKNNYTKALTIFQGQATHNAELIFSTNLNLSILLADYLDQKDKALEILNQQHTELSMSIEKYPLEQRNRMQDLVDLMSENIQRWKPQQEGDM